MVQVMPIDYRVKTLAWPYVAQYEAEAMLGSHCTGALVGFYIQVAPMFAEIQTWMI